MLMYGPARSIQYIEKDCIIYNFNSLIEGYQKLYLIPPNNLGATNAYEFDCNYMHYILDIDNNFIEFMKIMIPLYQNTSDVYLIIDDQEIWALEVIESLMKLIQQRYGINGVLIESKEDYLEANDDCFDPFFGINNMDGDSQRYQEIYYRVNGGKVNLDEL